MHLRAVAVSTGRICILPIAVFYVTVYFVFERLISFVLLVGAACDRVLGLNRALSRRPIAWLLATSLLTAALGAGIIDIRLHEPYLRGLAYAVVWVSSIYALIVAHFHVSAMPEPAALEEAIRARGLERWLARRLRNPLNAVFLRPMLGNSVLIIPLAAAVIVPRHVSWFAGLAYLAMLAVGGLVHESLDHTDIHNHLFRPREGASWGSGFVPRAMDRYLRAVLNPLFCRMPSFYRVQHIYIHHVENNGPDDVQTTVKHDRKSFFDFCLFALKCGASFAFAHDVIAYLRRRGKKRPLRQLLVGASYWVLILAAIAIYNPAAAMLLAGVRFFQGTAIAVNLYVWHGLADPSDPTNVFFNSINIRAGDTGGFPGALHMRHHQRMGEHWSMQCAVTSEEIEAAAALGALTLNVISPNLFLKALWVGRLELIAQAVVWPAPAKATVVDETNELRAMIYERTRPLVTRQRSRLGLRIDAACGRAYARYVVPGTQLPPAA